MARTPAPAELVRAVRALQARHRHAAAVIAERAYLRALARLQAFDDFTPEENRELAAEAALAELAYRFGP